MGLLKLINPETTRSHPGQRQGSLRKKGKKKEKLMTLQFIARSNGTTVTRLRQKLQQEVNRLGGGVVKVFSSYTAPRPEPVFTTPVAIRRGW